MPKKRKVSISRLPSGITKEKLLEVFTEIGKIRSVTIDNESKEKAIVEFKHQGDASRAIKKSLEIYGKSIKIKKYRNKSKSRKYSRHHQKKEKSKHSNGRNGYHRERQHHSPQDRERQHYSPQDGDRRNHSPRDRDRRNYSPHDRDRRNYSSHDCDRRHYSPRYNRKSSNSKYSSTAFRSAAIANFQKLSTFKYNDEDRTFPMKKKNQIGKKKLKKMAFKVQAVVEKKWPSQKFISNVVARNAHHIPEKGRTLGGYYDHRKS